MIPDHDWLVRNLMGFLKIMPGIPSYPMAVQHVELPDFFERYRRKSPQGQINDLFPQAGRHALAPAGRGIGGQVDHVFFETVIERCHE
jgi:hypothetical protein